MKLFNFDCQATTLTQSMGDAINLMLDEGIQKSNAALVHEAISFLEVQGNVCADAKARLFHMVHLDP